MDRRLRGSRTSSEASFFAASPSNYPGSRRLRQSVLYSDRPRRAQPRRPELAEENTREESSSELGGAVGLPTIEALSLSDPPLLAPQIAEESNDEYPVQPVPVGYGFGTVGSAPPPRHKWLGGVRGQGGFKKNTGDASSSELGPTVTVPSRSEALSSSDSSFIPQSTEEKPPKDSDADKEESRRLLREYYLKNPPTSLRQAFDDILAVEHATLTALAAEWGTEPPPPPRKLLPVDQETQSLQAEEHASAAVAQPETIPREPSHEASMEEIVENGRRWMHDEVMMCFRKYAERRSKLKILESHLDELCHQCFNVEDYNKVFHHYNFKVKMRKPDSADWTVRLYFAEVKEIFGRKYYFCCPLEPNENGHCYACLNQGVKDLKHPVTGGFEMGFTDATLFGYAEE
ncbi:unnamed protein product [Urochloa decumbens]|uniref:DUF3615 domain-containing protein n=1 Tax=Urochloa decumbens TaxID=240449 RepID=A0ABC9BIP8_9POAL